ncbi:MAG TPA: UDP-2,3-diacylglucosamine diphosphatase [Wenzhouxiangellaceae bacterium]|nr:UDP-2,3-diacylglucosamine diphosphatase [Wenzhouxiangellaceae bacterium]
MSDLHLGPSRPDITDRFRAFLAGPALEAEAIFILGDLFEAWIGDDAVGSFERDIAASLRALSQKGTRLAFLHGNRDFLLGPDYCTLCGMEMLDQPRLIDLYGTPTLVLHGDQLCTLDDQYQRYRARISQPEWQRRMLSRPLWFRRAVAALLRGASRLRNRRADSPKMDAVDEAVAALFLESGAERMIHGHTHRPFRHSHCIKDESRERIVLGDWYTQGSVLTVRPDSIELQSLDREPSPA